MTQEEDKIQKELEKYANQEKSLVDEISNFEESAEDIVNEGSLMPHGVIGMEKTKVLARIQLFMHVCFVIFMTDSFLPSCLLD